MGLTSREMDVFIGWGSLIWRSATMNLFLDFTKFGTGRERAQAQVIPQKFELIKNGRNHFFRPTRLLFDEAVMGQTYKLVIIFFMAILFIAMR